MVWWWSWVSGSFVVMCRNLRSSFARNLRRNGVSLMTGCNIRCNFVFGGDFNAAFTSVVVKVSVLLDGYSDFVVGYSDFVVKVSVLFVGYSDFVVGYSGLVVGYLDFVVEYLDLVVE